MTDIDACSVGACSSKCHAKGKECEDDDGEEDEDEEDGKREAKLVERF